MSAIIDTVFSSKGSTLAVSAGVCLPLLSYFGFNPSEVNPALGPLSVCYGITPIILRLPAVVFASYIKKI